MICCSMINWLWYGMLAVILHDKFAVAIFNNVYWSTDNEIITIRIINRFSAIWMLNKVIAAMWMLNRFVAIWMLNKLFAAMWMLNRFSAIWMLIYRFAAMSLIIDMIYWLQQLVNTAVNIICTIWSDVSTKSFFGKYIKTSFIIMISTYLSDCS